MRELDVFKDVLRNMIEGTMFHNQMIQYFDYLGLNGFAELQRKRFKDENDGLLSLEKYVVEVYGVVIDVSNVEVRGYIPQEWSENIRETVGGEEKKDYVRFGIETWKDWESKSKSYYSQCYFALNDLRDAGGSERIGDVVRETEREVRFAYNLMCKLRNSDYDMVAITLLDNDIVKMYEKFYKKGDM